MKTNHPGLLGPLLVSRFLLFALFQCFIFLIFKISGDPDAWHEAEGWWTFSALFTNILSIIFLVYIFRKEGKRYFEVFRFIREGWKKDLVIFLGLFILSGPISMLPNAWLARLLWDSTETSTLMLFRPLPLWALILSFGFPITIAFAELPTYFGTVMPRLQQSLKSSWWAMAIPAIFLALQHVTLPLIFDLRFMVWRFLMFLPFAFFVGICLKFRPRLLPYFMIAHGIMDVGTVAMLFYHT